MQTLEQASDVIFSQLCSHFVWFPQPQEQIEQMEENLKIK